jgi:molybdopterin-binding protein
MKLEAVITKIENVESLHIVSFDFGDTKLKMMSLDLDNSFCVGAKVLLSVKPVCVALAKNIEGVLSYSNQIVSKVISIEEGKLLSSIKLLASKNSFESIITTTSLKRMDLVEGDEVVALIKANDLSIMEVLG